MSNTTIQARISPKLKAESEAVFAAIGLKISDAIRMFLKQSVNDGGLPFRPHQNKVPNEKTITAIKEIEQKKSKKFKTVDALFEDLEN